MSRATHICGGPDARNQKVIVGGREVLFDYSDRFGPLLIDEEGNPLEKQPISERHAFWAPFSIWLAQWQKSNPMPLGCRCRQVETPDPGKPRRAS